MDEFRRPKIELVKVDEKYPNLDCDPNDKEEKLAKKC